MASALAASQCISSVAAFSAVSRPAASNQRVVAPRAALPSFKKIAQTAGVSVATLAVAFSANAANVKMGGDGGELSFIPSDISVKAGETVTFTNNAGFPHNVVFDEDAVPAGVDAAAISHDGQFAAAWLQGLDKQNPNQALFALQETLNAKGDTVTVTLTKPGKYEYYCEPHQGAGMAGSITVS